MAEVRIAIPDALVPTWAKLRSLVVLGWLAALQAQISGCSLPPIPWPTPTPAPVPPTPEPPPSPVVAGPLNAVYVYDPATETPTTAGLKTSVAVRSELPRLDCTWYTFSTAEEDAKRPGFAEVIKSNPAPFVAIYEPGGRVLGVVANPTESAVVAEVRRIRGK